MKDGCIIGYRLLYREGCASGVVKDCATTRFPLNTITYRRATRPPTMERGDGREDFVACMASKL